MTPIKVLFVCLGNICRSPAAEAVMNKLVSDSGLSGVIRCDSAGTGAYHAGEPADARMRATGVRRGYDLTSISRKITKQDFTDFDYIITMDSQNLADVEGLALQVVGNRHALIYPMCHFCRDDSTRDVPDPYYGGQTGFDRVFDLLDEACAGLLAFLRKEHGLG